MKTLFPVRARRNLALGLVLAISMVGISYGIGGDMGLGTEPAANGSATYPYLIEDLADFDVFADPCNSATYWSSGIYTKLTCDPNLTGRPYSIAVIAPDTSTSSGFQGTPFAGVFDGNGHIVRNLTIDTEGADNDYLGLFGTINDSNAEVHNLGIENINITGGDDSDSLGSLCGRNYYGSINNCYSTGSVAGGDSSDYLGGLCGSNSSGSISNCYSTNSVTGGENLWYLGGLCGKNYYGSNISNCYSTGPVTGGDYSEYLGGLCGSNSGGGSMGNCYSNGLVTGGNYSKYLGGLCGWHWEGSIINCYSNGPATGGDYSEYLGGLVGYNKDSISNCCANGSVSGGDDSDHIGGLCGGNLGLITNCYATGSVTGGNDLGGLCGWNSSGTITNCYATGSVFGRGYLGGLCGHNYYHGSINNCYSTGSVYGGDNSDHLGGMCGRNFGAITDCFWDTQSSGTTDGVGNEDPDPAGVTGRTTAEMQTQSTFVGWDFTNIWDICEGTNYPKLSWQFLAGDFACPDGVNLIDFAVFAETWSLSSGQTGYNDLCDLIDNDTIDINDLAVFAEHWLCR